MSFESLLFSELRTVAILPTTGTVTDSSLVKAMTVNEELKNIGYTLSPAGIIAIAKSDELDTFLNRIKSYIPDVKAKPMYPDFPTQVMGMDEAVFRFHQMLHYLSTYGIESITGQSVSKGWLPETTDTEKVEDDKTLLSAKVIQIFENSASYNVCDYAYKTILSKKERMTDKERLIIKDCLPHINETSYNVPVTFKQNLLDIFYFIFISDCAVDKKQILLSAICQHTGDVWKCMDYALTRCKFHFTTSQKRLIVKVLESYPAIDFQSNLILSNKKGTRTNLMLQYLDYNKYSRSLAHKNAVREFRNGELKSWESKAKYLISNKQDTALPFICSHPGIAIRNLTYLLRNGYKVADIYTNLSVHAKDLSTQTLVSLCTYFGITDDSLLYNEYAHTQQECENVYRICHLLLRDNLISKSTPIQNKNIYLDLSEYNLEQSLLLTNNKSSEGGYIRSGIAYNIPEDIKRIRFFVYWDDKSRVDVDLHACAMSNTRPPVRIGWCSDYDNTGIVFSGDITHSDAAEFIDVDLDMAKEYGYTDTTFNINLYCGKPSFKEIDECFVGCMAVDEIGARVKLYNPKNCFFVHNLTSNTRMMNYGYLDIVNRCIVFDGVSTGGYYEKKNRPNTQFTLQQYITDLLTVQNSNIVNSKEEADYILVMGKPNSEKEISLIDNNFFMDI